MVRSLSLQLRHAGFDVDGVSRVADVTAAIEHFAPEALVLDYVMPDVEELELLTTLRAQDATLAIVMLSGIMDVPLTVRAIRAGASDVLAKPADTELLLTALDRGVAHTRLLRAHRNGGHRPVDPFGFIDDSPAMQRVVRMVEQVATGTMPVLLIGEPGTGKRALAQLVHQHSSRAGQTFALLACEPGDRERVERLLLGHSAHSSGSDSAADDESSAGLLQRSAAGTLVLDEPATLSLAVQDALTVLTASPRQRSGGARLVVTTRRDLADDVRRGTLRSDLYQSLSAMPIVVPPLRDRGDVAIRQLAERALAALHDDVNEGPRQFTTAALAELYAEPWRGNVRQLHAVIEEAFALALDDIAIDSPHVQAVFSRRGLGDAHAGSDDYSLRSHERQLIARVLSMTGGQRTEAARLLGITRTTLYKKIDDYGLS